MKTYRIGIDVGGTFTHAVAVEGSSLKLVGKSKVPTTHHSASGVGEGVVQSLKLVMDELGIQAAQINFVAHSTTQATNSLLEGDVDPVVIVSIGSGANGALASRGAELGDIPLSPGRFLKTRHHHYDPENGASDAALSAFLAEAKADGLRVAVACGPFSVDDPSLELLLAEKLKAAGFLVSATHEVSQLYGVKVRARTSAINASILPKMMEVAEKTDREIRKLGITAPLMIMRSDGGVMSLEEMRKKPILTLLSGPAAGIAAALRFLKISDGIFLEVGGTSTDISVIKNGRALVRSASIGGNRTYLKTLDCRTLGIGGGSIPRVQGTNVTAVGPRSAHIAKVKYAAFETGALGAKGISKLQKKTVQPKDGDPNDYLVFEAEGSRLSLTPTCASNALGFVPDGDAARSKPGFPEGWDEKLRNDGFADGLKGLSESILQKTSEVVSATVKSLMKEYQLKPEWVSLVGGGGGASAIVPHLAKTLGLQFEIAAEADVISAIGVALGLVREVVERSSVSPSREELYRLRQEAVEKVIAQGADPKSVEVFVAVDTQKNIIRAEAQGAIDYKAGADDRPGGGILTEWPELAHRALGIPVGTAPSSQAESTGLQGAVFDSETKAFLGLVKKKRRDVLVRDRRGVVRMKIPQAALVQTDVGRLTQTLAEGLDARGTFGDAGLLYPYAYALVGERIVDLSRLAKKEHQLSVLELEIQGVPPQDPAALVFSFESSEIE